MLAPGPPERPMQFVDVRDLAAWIARRGRAGARRAVQRDERRDALGRACSPAPTVTWVPDEFLQEREVGEWMELPLWIAGVGMRTDVSRAVAAGLRFRPVEESIAGAADAPAVEGVGLTPEREAELLAAWRGRAAA